MNPKLFHLRMEKNLLVLGLIEIKFYGCESDCGEGRLVRKITASMQHANLDS